MIRLNEHLPNHWTLNYLFLVIFLYKPCLVRNRFLLMTFWWLLWHWYEERVWKPFPFYIKSYLPVCVISEINFTSFCSLDRFNWRVDKGAVRLTLETRNKISGPCTVGRGYVTKKLQELNIFNLLNLLSTMCRLYLWRKAQVTETWVGLWWGTTLSVQAVSFTLPRYTPSAPLPFPASSLSRLPLTTHCTLCFLSVVECVCRGVGRQIAIKFANAINETFKKKSKEVVNWVLLSSIKYKPQWGKSPVCFLYFLSSEFHNCRLIFQIVIKGTEKVWSEWVSEWSVKEPWEFTSSFSMEEKPFIIAVSGGSNNWFTPWAGRAWNEFWLDPRVEVSHET